MSSKAIKQNLLKKLKQEHCFWSYNESSIKEVSDDLLIEKTLLYLDLDEINLLFQLYPFKKIKQVWLERLVPQRGISLYAEPFFCVVLFQSQKTGCLS